MAEGAEASTDQDHRVPLAARALWAAESDRQYMR